MNATPQDLYPDPIESDFAATDTTAMATETTLLNPRFYTCLLYTSPSPRDRG